MATTRRQFLSRMGLCSAGFAAAALSRAGEPRAAKPNVLFVAVDDLRPELNCYGRPQIISPAIDGLAASGVIFDRAYCQQAVCAASRSSLLSGCRPDTTGIYGLNTPLRKAMPDVRTLPEHFRANGYETVSIGKIYHHGSDDYPKGWSAEPMHPRGEWKGRGYLDPASLRVVEEFGRENGAAAKGRGPAFEGPDVPDSAYPDGMIADEAIRQLNRLREEPFFLAVGFMKPHLPFNAPKRYWDMYKPEDIRPAAHPSAPEGVTKYSLTNFGELRAYPGIPSGKDPLPDSLARQLIHGYYACCTYMDAQFGRVLAELDRLGLRENTVIVLWGDHGWKLGDHGEWCKHTNFEIDTRVPMIFSARGLEGRGRRTSALSEFVDIYPTLCELAGLPVPGHLEGTSLVPVLNAPDIPWKKAAFSQYPRGGIMGHAMRTARWRYVEWQDRKSGEVAARELYDHETDPGENRNIAENPAHAETVRLLSAQLAAGWKAARPG